MILIVFHPIEGLLGKTLAMLIEILSKLRTSW